MKKFVKCNCCYCGSSEHESEEHEDFKNNGGREIRKVSLKGVLLN